MKKIIAALDGLKLSDGTADYAIRMAKQENAHLVGVFLEDFVYTSYKVYDLIYEKGGLIGSAKRKWDNKDAKTRGAAVSGFEIACQTASISYSVHRDRRVAIQELLHETIYADLLIIDRAETFSRFDGDNPTDFVKDVLANAQCPVMVVPNPSCAIDKLVLLYDGTPSSLYAIKMLSYTLPALKRCPVELIVVASPEQSHHVPDKMLLKEFMTRHFPAAIYTILKGDVKEEIVRHLSSAGENSLVVLGAYCRGGISRWIHPSLADMLMNKLNLPIFIAHNK